MTEIEKLVVCKEALEAQLLNEKANLNKIASEVSWVAGMRRTVRTPIFRFEKEIRQKIEVLENQVGEKK